MKIIHDPNKIYYLEAKEGTWGAQSVERPTLGLSSGHDFTVGEFEPCIGLCADISAPTWGSVSPLSALPHLHSLSQNKLT